MWKLKTNQSDRINFDAVIYNALREQLRLLDKSDLRKVRKSDWKDYVENGVYDTVDDVAEARARIKAEFARALDDLRVEQTERITITEAARRFNKSAVWLRRLCQQGRIPSWKVSPRLYLVDPNDMEAWFAKKTRPGRPRKTPQ